jgi:hypothetical protein
MGQVSPRDPHLLQKISRLPRPANIPRSRLLFGSLGKQKVRHVPGTRDHSSPPPRASACECRFVFLVHASNPLLPNFCTDTWKKFSIEKRWVRNLEPSLSRLGRCQYLFSYETHGLFLHWTTVLHFSQLGPQTLVLATRVIACS